ncbi:MAG: hypothetical protein LBJ15_16335 [Comamonas sp.]|jgi:hypothetical protein|uniref:hypothetical protein n=1 Tax=Comamonas sp. TaxID=34028 RepID=UPI0028273B8E|nr:hypothetical protein [Comamonas sp.]MDR0215551.1 hypothetical protein [Comamonas sp.]
MSGRRLIRQIKAGESLSFDGGRLVVTLLQRTNGRGGSRAELCLRLEDDVVVDKPPEQIAQSSSRTHYAAANR